MHCTAAAATETGRASRGTPVTPEYDESTRRLGQLLESIPAALLARAAFGCGAHARALQYYETHVRACHGGGLNPAALHTKLYPDADVSFLQVALFQPLIAQSLVCRATIDVGLS